jgi:endonuclease YncB( thermonuclease family)
MHFPMRRSRLPKSITVQRRWRRYVWPTVALAVAAILAVSDRARRGEVQGDDWTRYHDRSFRVVRVVDGDTIVIDAPDNGKDVTRVRLWGVDAPETASGDMEDTYFGPEAKAFAERTLQGRHVHIVLSPKRTRGKYGRLLAYVDLTRGGRMFNEMLLEEGYAYADLRFDHHYYKRFRSIEKRARNAGVGLWADVALSQMPEWKQRFERKNTTPGD